MGILAETPAPSFVRRHPRVEAALASWKARASPRAPNTPPLAQHPTIGSPRYAFELRLEGLRAWPLRKYPYLVFYVEREDHLDVWRVLHAQRDIPAWVQEPEAQLPPP